MLSWLFGRPKKAATFTRLYLEGDGSFEYDIVGEASYQDALDRICGGKCEDGHEFEVAALLIEEPDNPADPNAVRAVISGATVGYLPRKDAPLFKAKLRDAGISGHPKAGGAVAAATRATTASNSISGGSQ